MQEKVEKKVAPKKKLNMEVKTLEPRTATRHPCGQHIGMSDTNSANQYVNPNDYGLVIGIN